MTDLREEGLLAPSLPIREQPLKGLSLIGLKAFPKIRKNESTDLSQNDFNEFEVHLRVQKSSFTRKEHLWRRFSTQRQPFGVVLEHP